MSFKKLSKNKGLSAVIATVMLILISVLAVIMMSSFLMPMLKELMGKSKACFEVQETFSVIDVEYTCSSASNTSLSISRTWDKSEVSGIALAFMCGTESKSFKLLNATAPSNIGMYKLGVLTPLGSEVVIPSQGETRTYLFNDTGNCDSVIFGPILPSGDTCEQASYEIREC